MVMQYELVVIVDPQVSEKEKQTALTTLLDKEGFSVMETVVWGKKTLAYPVKKKNEGFYFSFILDGASQKTAQVTKQLELDEEVLRYLVLRKN